MQCFGISALRSNAMFAKSVLCRWGIVPAVITGLLTLEEGFLITDLPVMALHFRALEDECRCATCSSNDRDFNVCRKPKFLEHFSVVVADILVLSLFDCPEPIRVSNVLIRPGRNV